MPEEPAHADALTDSAAMDLLGRDVVFEFYWRFSRFECELKRGGFLRSGRNNSAQPDWDRFGASVRGRFDSLGDGPSTRAIAELELASPRRQTVNEGELAWETIRRDPNISRESHVLRLLRATRNNLFHGGKYPDGPVDEVARNREILNAALRVLDVFEHLRSNSQ